MSSSGWFDCSEFVDCSEFTWTQPIYDYWDYYPKWQTAPQEGWLCPRCGTVNAPWKGHCDCRPATIVITNGQED